MRRVLLAMVLGLIGCSGQGPGQVTPAVDGFPGLGAIRQSELERDLYALAGDGFRGREAGTLDELRASVWLAERARAAGLEPAGEDQTYFQFFSIRRTRTAESSKLVVDGTELRLGVDAVILVPTPAHVEGAPVGPIGEITGRIVVTDLAVKAAIDPNVSLRPVRYAYAGIQEQAPPLIGRGAAAVILIGDATADSGWAFVSAGQIRGQYAVDGGAPPRVGSGSAPIVWVKSVHRDLLRRATKIEISVAVENFLYPSVNVVGRVRGTDPALAGQYVLFSGHQDHDGVRGAIAGDSIWNGADDNASVSVAVLAIGRAFVAKPARRSALFVWHGAEERGLLGSRWHAAHPMVPKDSIVAVLNADMIGGNHPDSAALLGVQPPHRNSTALAQMALDANDRVGRFALDTLWDRPTHPEGWYFRSDHAPYARAGIPAVYFSTLLHPRYHTPDDEPDRINYPKLTRVTKWMYATGWLAANAGARPAIDPGVKLER